MEDLRNASFAMTIVTGAVYFWYKARFFNVGWIKIILGYMFFPVAVVMGLYWAIRDCWMFGFPSRLSDSRKDGIVDDTTENRK